MYGHQDRRHHKDAKNQPPNGMLLAQGDGLAGPEEVMTARFDRENAQAALDWLFQPGDVVEVRIPKAKRLKPVSGYFNSREKLIDALRSASGEYAAVYYT